MKRLLPYAMLLVLLLQIVFSINVFAVEKEAIKYGANESFIIIIPSGFTLTNLNEYTTNIIAEDVLISTGKTLKVIISSNNYDKEWRAEEITSEGNFIVYKVGTDEKYSTNSGDIILSVSSGERYNGKVEQKLWFKASNASILGNYHDVLTFIAEVQ